MSVFAYRLIPPRPDFALTLTDRETAIMTEHVGYWTEQLNHGVAVVFGPVADPDGGYGLGVIETKDEDAVHSLAARDPAILSGLCRYEVFAMPGAVVRPWGPHPG